MNESRRSAARRSRGARARRVLDGERAGEALSPLPANGYAAARAAARRPARAIAPAPKRLEDKGGGGGGGEARRKLALYLRMRAAGGATALHREGGARTGRFLVVSPASLPARAPAAGSVVTLKAVGARGVAFRAAAGCEVRPRAGFVAQGCEARLEVVDAGAGVAVEGVEATGAPAAGAEDAFWADAARSSVRVAVPCAGPSVPLAPVEVSLVMPIPARAAAPPRAHVEGPRMPPHERPHPRRRRQTVHGVPLAVSHAAARGDEEAAGGKEEGEEEEEKRPLSPRSYHDVGADEPRPHQRLVVMHSDEADRRAVLARHALRESAAEAARCRAQVALCGGGVAAVLVPRATRRALLGVGREVRRAGVGKRRVFQARYGGERRGWLLCWGSADRAAAGRPLQHSERLAGVTVAPGRDALAFPVPRPAELRPDEGYPVTVRRAGGATLDLVVGSRADLVALVVGSAALAARKAGAGDVDQAAPRRATLLWWAVALRVRRSRMLERLEEARGEDGGAIDRGLAL